MILVRVNGRDLSSYVRGHKEDGLDPSPAAFEPQFGGSAAFGEGQPWTGDSVGNREWTIPLILDADDRSSLHSLIRDIGLELEKGGVLEFATDSADPTTFFDVERGRLDTEYDYFLHRSNVTRATLKLWTRPRGHSGTSRLVASQRYGSAMMGDLVATSVIGDVAAMGALRLTTNERLALGSNTLIAYGVHRSASVRGVWTYASMVDAGIVPMTLTGASGAIASQYREYKVVPTISSAASATRLFRMSIPYNLRSAYAGRYRVMGLFRSRMSGPSIGITLQPGDTMGSQPVVAGLGSAGASGPWKLLDMGEWSPPAVPTSAGALPNAFHLYVGFVGASGASAVATSPVHFNALALIPLDVAAGVFVPSGAVPNNSVLTIGAHPRPYVDLHLASTSSDQWEFSAIERLRGDPPRLPVTGTPGPSGPIGVTIVAGSWADANPGQGFTAALHAVERFSFLR